MNIRYQDTLVSLLCLFLIGNTYAQDTLDQPVKVDTSIFMMDTLQHMYPLKDYVQILQDPTDKYEIIDFLEGGNSKLFKPLAEFSYKDLNQASPPWIKVSIRNNTDRTFWSFELWTYSDSTLAYTINEDKSIDSFKLGRHIAYEEAKSGVTILNDTYSNARPIFFNIKKGEQKDIFYKIYRKSLRKDLINPNIKSMEARYKSQHNMHFYYIKAFFYLGLLWMLFIYNFITYLFNKNKSYLYLSLFICTLLMPSASRTKELIIKEWFSNIPFDDAYWAISVPLFFIFLVLFIREYLNVQSLSSKFDLMLKSMIGITFIYFALMLGIYLINGSINYQKAIRFTVIHVIVQTVLFIIVAIQVFKHKKTEIRFLILSISVLVFFNLSHRLPEIFEWKIILNNIHYVLEPINLSEIGVLLQVMIWTMSLGAKSRKIAEDKKLLEEKDAFKSQFFVNISHEFRTPLTLVLGPIQQIIDKTTDQKDKALLMMAHRNANRQLRLINELLDLSKLEANKMKLQTHESDFIPVLRGIFYSYDSLAEQRSIVLEITNPTEPVLLYFDQEKMEKIFYNLLSNAFKFTFAGGKISISLVQNKKSVSIKISDTGAGISKEKLDNIFDRFFQAESSKETYYEGSGIGLTLTKELVELHHGIIRVTSQLGQGTIFHLEFPLGKVHLQVNEIVDQPMFAQSIHQNTNFIELKENLNIEEAKEGARSSKSSKRPTLLIVEDNKDMRAFIHQKLEGDYQIIEAFDGEAGIQKAIEHLPDLIISDVMMPNKNGYELCKTLKSDVRTSHIPVILLTARAAQEEKIEGLETGADDYLTKPFDAKELLIRVQNLIAIREQLRQRFAAAINLKPSEVTTNSIDAEFLQNAMQIIEANIDDENFTIDIFTHKVGMSRSTLNRKLRALTNQTINQFIQAARLNRAADLLRQKSGTVAEIAFQTGFRSTAYFVKCFKDKFGVTPGKFESSPKRNS